MKLAGKFVVIIVGMILLLIAVDGYLSVRREIEHFQAEAERESRMLGHAMKYLLADVWAVNGEKRALQIIADVNRGEKDIHIRWVWLDGAATAAHSPAVPVVTLDRLLSKNDPTLHFPNRGADGYNYTYVAVSLPDRDRAGALELAMPLGKMHAYVRRTIYRSGFLALVVAAVGAVAVIALGYNMIGRSLQQITAKIRRIGTGDLSQPLLLSRHDEIGEVAQGLNGMCDELKAARWQLQVETEARIEALERLRHKDRLETIGALASGIAHELGTPLNVVLGRAGLIKKGILPEDKVSECAEIIRKQCERMTRIIKRLLNFARRKPAAKRKADLAQCLQHVIELLEPLARRTKVQINFRKPDTPADLVMDDAQIEQVLTNLIMNAIQAMPDGGDVDVVLKTRQAPSEKVSDPADSVNECLCVEVRDYGPGIEPKHIDHLFEPFFSTKAAGEGTGLGLAIAAEIVQDHGGWIEVDSEPGEGSCFTVWLPREDQE